MATTVTRDTVSLPVGKVYVYDVVNAAGTTGAAQAVTLTMDYTPTHAICQAYGTVANYCAYDPATLTSTTINLYFGTTAAGGTSAKVIIW